MLVRLWLGFWRGLTAFRIAVFNILFLIVLALLVRVIFFPGDEIIVDEKNTLVLAPEGYIVEEYTGTPMQRAIDEALGQEVPETRLRDLLAALEHAASDERIVQVLLRTDELWGVAPGMQTELAKAFAEFRESGKQVIAYGGMMMQSQYILASMADEIWLDRDGMILFEGSGSASSSRRWSRSSATTCPRPTAVPPRPSWAISGRAGSIAWPSTAACPSRSWSS